MLFGGSVVSRPRRLRVSPRRDGNRDTWSMSTVSSMKPSAQRHAQAQSVEMATTHVTVVATYFHYCRKVTLCLNGKSPNYNFTTPTRYSTAPQLSEDEMEVWIDHFIWKYFRNLPSKVTNEYLFSQKSQVHMMELRRSFSFEDQQFDYLNPVLSRCTFPWLYKGGSDQ